MLDEDALGLLAVRPPGDPEEMRRYAAALRSWAQRIAAAGREAAGALEAATFVGPAGDAARMRARRLRTRSADQAGELGACAEAIVTRAGAIARAQAAWDARLPQGRPAR